MKKSIKISLIVIVLIAVIIFVAIPYLPRIFGLLSSDISIVDETGLVIDDVKILDKENAYFDLEKISSVIYFPKNIYGSVRDISSGKSWNKSLVDEILLKNKQTLEYFSGASTKSFLQNPLFTRADELNADMPMSHLNDWRNASRISALKAISLSKQGLDREAMEEAIKSVTVGKLIMSSTEPLIEYLVGVAVKSIGLNAVDTILSQDSLNKSDLLMYSSELSKLHDSGEGLKKVFTVEYFINNRGLDRISSNLLAGDSKAVDGSDLPNFAKNNIKNFYYFRLNETKQLSADYARQQIKNVDVTCSNVQSILESNKLAPISSPISYIKLYFTENAVGKILRDVVSDSLGSIFSKRCDVEGHLISIIDKLNK